MIKEWQYAKVPKADKIEINSFFNIAVNKAIDFCFITEPLVDPITTTRVIDFNSATSTT
jgi:hypothetical protein